MHRLIIQLPMILKKQLNSPAARNVSGRAHLAFTREHLIFRPKLKGV